MELSSSETGPEKRKPKRIISSVKFIIGFCFLIFFLPNQLVASRIMGMELAYSCLGGDSFLVTITLYRNCSEIIPEKLSSFLTLQVSSTSCGQNLSFTIDESGTAVEISQLCDAIENQSICQGGIYPGIRKFTYSDTIQLPASCTDWVLSVENCCRYSQISNLQSPETRFLHIEAMLNNVAGSCNNSPVFTGLPVPYMCKGQLFGYNNGILDSDGDSLVFSLIAPLDSGGVAIPYNSPYSTVYPINTTTGTVEFDSKSGQFIAFPDSTQTYVLAFLVQEYRNGILIGSTMRDMEFTVIECDPSTLKFSNGGIFNFSGGTSATQVDSNSVSVCIGESISFDLELIDSLISGIMDVSTNLSQTIPGADYSVSGVNPALFHIEWNPVAGDGGYHSFSITSVQDVCPFKIKKIFSFDITIIPGIYTDGDVYLCSGDTTQLFAFGGDTFIWSPPIFISDISASNPFVWPDSDLAYIVTTNLSGVCKSSDTVNVYVGPAFNLSVTPSLTVCFGGSALLNATASPPASYTYLWSPSFGLDNDTIQNPAASPTATTMYSVHVIHPDGCEQEKNVLVTVNPYHLTIDPTKDGEILCVGDSMLLHANPPIENCNQYLVDSIPYSLPAAGGYTDINIYSDNVVSNAINLNFDFEFFCNWYDQVYISSNGWLSFTSQTNPYPLSSSIPVMAVPNNIIAFAWCDLNPVSGNASIGYKITGTVPNQKFILKFENVKYAYSNNTVTVYVVLYEGTNAIEIYSTAIYSDFNNKTQGIENSNGSAGYTVPGRNYTTWSAYNDAYRFTPLILPPFTLSWYDQNGFYLSNASDISVKPDSATTYTVQITDGSCVDQKNVKVNVMSVSAGKDVYVCPGDSVQLSSTFSSSKTFVAPTACGVSTGCSGSGVINNVVVGTGTTTNTSTTYPAPYGNWYRNAKHQFLFTASELSAAGLNPGTITALSWFVSAIQGTTIYYGYTIKIACTNITSLTTWQSGLTTVFNPKTVTITTGWNSHTLDNYFDWDGTSNIIIEICYNNLAYTYTYNSLSPYTTTGFSSCIYFYSDGTATCPYTSPPSAATFDRPNIRFTLCRDSIINQYRWMPTNGLSDSAISNPLASPDSTTQYVLTLTNQFCTLHDTVVVNVGLNVELSTFPASCLDVCDGTAIADSKTGISPYTYQWSDPANQTNDTAVGLCTGNYTVTVTDSSGCKFSDSIIIALWPQPGHTTMNTPLSCYGDSDAIATIVFTGQQFCYYLWSNGQTTSTATGLSAGTYSVTATIIANGCTYIDSVQITEPLPMTITDSVNPGNIYIIVTGGTPPYMYVWGNDCITDNMFSVTVTDFNGCVDSLSDTCAVGIADKQVPFPEIFLYPNPSSGKFNIKIVGGRWIKEEVYLTIYNVLGENVTQSVIPKGAGNFTLDLNAAPKGIYLLKITNGVAMATKRIFIE